MRDRATWRKNDLITVLESLTPYLREKFFSDREQDIEYRNNSLQIALNDNDDPIHIREATRSTPYKCMECNRTVYPRSLDGRRKPHYYHHNPPADLVCEGDLHAFVKHLLFKYYANENSIQEFPVLCDNRNCDIVVEQIKLSYDEVEMEYRIPTGDSWIQPDIVFKDKNIIHAIEVVVNHHPEQKVIEHVLSYGGYVLEVILSSKLDVTLQIHKPEKIQCDRCKEEAKRRQKEREEFNRGIQVDLFAFPLGLVVAPCSERKNRLNQKTIPCLSCTYRGDGMRCTTPHRFKKYTVRSYYPDGQFHEATVPTKQLSEYIKSQKKDNACYVDVLSKYWEEKLHLRSAYLLYDNGEWRYRSYNEHATEQIDELLTYTLNFGKYRGKTLYSIIKRDRPYLNWLNSISPNSIKLFDLQEVVRLLMYYLQSVDHPISKYYDGRKWIIY